MSPASNSSNVSPRDPRLAGFGNHRRELAVLETSAGRIPSIQHNPPTAVQSTPNQVAPWMSANGKDVDHPSTGFGSSFYDDSGDTPPHRFQPPPGGRGEGTPSTSERHSDALFEHERRPSAASVTTLSSSGSKSSRGGGLQNKKLQTFFGEDFPGRDGSDTSLPTQGQETPRETAQEKEGRSHSFARGHRERNLSSATDTTHRDASPAGSRPRTPVPSSDVVPFLYQDSQVSHSFVVGICI